MGNLGGAGRPLYFHCAICKYDLCMDCAAPPPLPPPASGPSVLRKVEEHETSGSETVEELDDNDSSHCLVPPGMARCLAFAPRMTSREEAAMRIIDEVASERARILQQVHKASRLQKSTLVTEAELLQLQPEYISAKMILQNRFADLW